MDSDSAARAATEHADYITFCQSLAMPIDLDNDDQDGDDSDFCLDDELNNAAQNGAQRVSVSATGRVSLSSSSTSTVLELSAVQITKIRNLLSNHFQMAMTLRLLTIDKLEFREQHRVCDDLLRDLREKRLKAAQSIRSSALHGMSYGHNQSVSAFSLIEGMSAYFAFNRTLNKSLSENFVHFKEVGVALAESLKPPFSAIPSSKKKKWSVPHFSRHEMALLDLAMREYGHSVAMKSGLMAPDWTSIQSRYFPHKSIRFLQCKVGRLRDSDRGRARPRARDKATEHGFRSDFGRTRSKPRRMTAEERRTLLSGIERFGLRDWAAISRQLLPKWTRIELRKQFYRNIKPQLLRDGELQILSRFHGDKRQRERAQNGNGNEVEHKHSEQTDAEEWTWNSDRFGFPVLSQQQQLEVLRDEYLMDKMRKQIRGAIRNRQRVLDPDGNRPIDFFNPAADAYAERESPGNSS